MASMWGRAWGDSWGLSWGLTYEANQTDLTKKKGGIGHGKGGKRQRKFVEYEGQILVFADSSDAQAWLDAQVKEVPKQKKKKKVPKPVKQISVEKIEDLIVRYPEVNYQPMFDVAIKTGDIEKMYRLWEALIEIEDEEILLLAA